MAINQLKLRVDGLYPTLESFNGTVPIHFLKFLATMYEAFSDVGSSKSDSVRTLTYYL